MSIIGYVLIMFMLFSGMVMSTQEVGLSSDSRSSASTEPIDEWMWELISSEITHGILEWIHVIFSMVNEGILDECLGAFRIVVMATIRAHTLSFCDFRACEAPDFFGEKDSSANKRWLTDMDNVFQNIV